MNRPLRVLTVCTHNRARSVAMAAHLQAHLAARRLHAHLVSAGFNDTGLPATPEVAAALAANGLDVSAHRSRRVTGPMAEGADLIVTAERIHVMRVCEDDHGLFARTFTLPELVNRAEAVGPRRQAPLEEWLAALNEGRSQATFLTSPVGQIADPTGLSAIAVAAAVADIGDWCRRLAVLL